MTNRLLFLFLALTFAAWVAVALNHGYAITGATGGVAVMGFGLAWVVAVAKAVRA